MKSTNAVIVVSTLAIPSGSEGAITLHKVLTGADDSIIRIREVWFLIIYFSVSC